MAGSKGDWFKTPRLAERLRRAGVRDDLVEAASRTAFTRPGDALLKLAEELLDLDEAVIAVAEGRRDRRRGLIVLTTRRVLLIFVSRGSTTPQSENLTDITEVSSQTRRGMGRLTITTCGVGGSAGQQLVIDQMLGNQADTLAGDLRRPRPCPPPG